jgi:quinol monooxygenase YgiN
MSSKVYCIASFKPKAGKADALFRTLQSLEPDTLREEGCERYVVTRHIANPFAQGESFPIVFNEVWRNLAAFESHCARKAIVEFFQRECVDPEGLVEAYNVCVYTDEAEDYDRPR